MLKEVMTCDCCDKAFTNKRYFQIEVHSRLTRATLRSMAKGRRRHVRSSFLDVCTGCFKKMVAKVPALKMQTLADLRRQRSRG